MQSESRLFERFFFTEPLRIEKLVAGGDGLARPGGKVVFVPMVLPGELVEASVAAEGKGYRSARVERILEPSPHRREAPCPLYGVCGGCNLQHAEYAHQLEVKRRILCETLARVGGQGLRPERLQELVEAAGGSELGYRSRVRLHPAAGGGLGFRKRASHEVVEVAHCPIAVDGVNELLADPAGCAGLQAPLQRPVRVFAVPKSRCHGAGLQRDDPKFDPKFEGLANESPARCIAAVEERGDARQPDRRRGDPGQPDAPAPTDTGGLGEQKVVVQVPIAGKAFAVSPHAFFQNNIEMLECVIQEEIIGLSGERAVDLYAGVAVFAAFLADGFRRVAAIESDPAAAATAKRNLAGTGARFVRSTVEHWVTRNRFKGDDLVLLDPPRNGLGKTVTRALLRDLPRRVVYVSCDPATLARDLKALCGAGYVLDRVKLYDFYPQTAEIETVVRLSWSAG